MARWRVRNRASREGEMKDIAEAAVRFAACRQVPTLSDNMGPLDIRCSTCIANQYVFGKKLCLLFEEIALEMTGYNPA